MDGPLDGSSSPTASSASSLAGLGDGDGAWGSRSPPYASSVDSSPALPLSSSGGVPLSALRAPLDAWALSPDGAPHYKGSAVAAPPPRRSLVGMLFGLQGAPAYGRVPDLHDE